MTVLDFSTGDKFRVTIVKYHTNNPDRKWGNNYEAVAASAGAESHLTALGNALVDFEKDLHFDQIVFDRLRISTWEEDSVPYDPETFISLPLSGPGTRPTAGIELNAINVCWDVARFPLSGRFGHLFYRGCLSESDTIAPAGKFVLANPSGMSGTLSAARGAASLDDYLNGEGAVLNLAMINKDGTQVRSLVSLISRGVSVVPFDHAWFNRTTGA